MPLLQASDTVRSLKPKPLSFFQSTYLLHPSHLQPVLPRSILPPPHPHQQQHNQSPVLNTPLQVLAILSSGALVSIPLQTHNPLTETTIGQILPAPPPPAKLSAVARRRPTQGGDGELWVISAGEASAARALESHSPPSTSFVPSPCLPLPSALPSHLLHRTYFNF